MAQFIDVTVPALGEGVEKMLLVAWCVEPGGAVKADEPLFEVETDKVAFEVEAEVCGILAEVLVPAGEAVAPGDVIARIEAA